MLQLPTRRTSCPDCLNRQAKSRTGIISCFFCDEPGHVKADCQEWEAWKRQKAGMAATAVSDYSLAAPMPMQGKCCTLPRVVVNVRNESGVFQQACAIVDTCSTKNLVTWQLAEALAVPVTECESNIVTIGSPMSVEGVTEMSVMLTDQNVYLLECVALCTVVESLSAVNTDIVIGVNLISGLGSVNVDYGDGILVGVVFGQKPGAASTIRGVCEPSPIPPS